MNTLAEPFANVAFEEAMLTAADVPTLRIWFNQRSVVIGRGQLAESETDLDYCRAGSIPVVRRCTAGGAVYNGPGNLNWTFVVPGEGQTIRRLMDANGVFTRFAKVVVGALGECGVAAKFVPPNSIYDGTGKVSGMAAYVSKGNVLCHGTLLHGADLHEVVRLTTPKPEVIDRRYPRSRSVKVSNCKVSPEAFVKKVSEAAGGFDPGVPTQRELAAADGLLPRYKSASWNLGDPFA